ncbi:MAG: aminotransferase class V-fold PLP-dependent enzyme [Hymenobacter sp.]
MLHFSHITNLTGQIFPVQNLARMARARGIITIVDGAHAAAHFPFKLRDLEMVTTAPACTSGCWRRPERDSSTCAAIASRRPADAGRAERARPRHPQVRGDRHLAGGNQSRRSTKRWRSTQAIGTEQSGRTPALPDAALGQQAEGQPRVVLHTGLDQAYGVACVGIKDIPATKVNSFMRDKCGSSPPRSPGRSTAASASRRTSTHRSRRSTRSLRRWKTC